MKLKEISAHEMKFENNMDLNLFWFLTFWGKSRMRMDEPEHEQISDAPADSC